MLLLFYNFKELYSRHITSLIHFQRRFLKKHLILRRSLIGVISIREFVKVERLPFLFISYKQFLNRFITYITRLMQERNDDKRQIR